MEEDYSFYKSINSAIFAIEIGQTNITEAGELIAEDFSCIDKKDIQLLLTDLLIASTNAQIAKITK